MSKSSPKQRLTQLVEWMSTLKPQRSRPIKNEDTKQPPTRSYNVRIKNM
jgi:hypothetical protein